VLDRFGETISPNPLPRRGCGSETAFADSAALTGPRPWWSGFRRR